MTVNTDLLTHDLADQQPTESAPTTNETILNTNLESIPDNSLPDIDDTQPDIPAHPQPPPD
jgi:hypothetical protein